MTDSDVGVDAGVASVAACAATPGGLLRHERDQRGFEERGQSGNPSGRPKQDQNIVELARAHGPRAIEVLAELVNNPKATASSRAMAADRILDRGYGKPPQLTTTDAGQFRRACDMPHDELARIAAFTRVLASRVSPRSTNRVKGACRPDRRRVGSLR